MNTKIDFLGNPNLEIITINTSNKPLEKINKDNIPFRNISSSNTSIISANELLKTKLEPVQWIAETILPKGLTLLAARPKTGKSFLALNLAVSTAKGELALNKFQTSKSNVLYIGNEDSFNRLQNRLSKILSNNEGEKIEVPKNLYLMTDFPKLNLGGLEVLENHIKELNLGFVIIDTFFKSFEYPDNKKNAYTLEYEFTGMFQTFARKNKICFMMVHHTKKASSDYMFDNVLGTTGITGSADTIWIIENKNNKSTLEITGKDVESLSYEINFDKNNCTWSYIGESTFDINTTPERFEILQLLMNENKEMKTSEIAKALGKRDNNISSLLKGMEKSSLIKKIKYGIYSL